MRRLPPPVSKRVAAGEVVERPASVVKELVENALDAGATAISMEIRDGGLSLIRVTDNGHGMTAEDVSLAFERFTTSKIHTLEDLNAIRTFGFRGEALAAIAAVAEVEVLTRSASTIQGVRARVHPGRRVQVEPAAAPVGTQVTVRRLFANVPARRKFIKSPLREAELIHQVLVRYALAFPQVAFRLIVNSRLRLRLPPTPPEQRVGQVLGRDVADNLLEISWNAGDMHVQGWISSPQISKPNRQSQFFTVNRRPIRSGLLAVILERAYAGRIPPGRKPVAVVDITLDPRFIDVNVHPRKAEVRFAQERSVYWALGQAVQQALEPFPALQSTDDEDAFAAFPLPIPTGDLEARSVREERPAYGKQTPQSLAQLHATYILAQDEYGLLLIDQHAAHEQVLFERVLAAVDTPTPLSPPVIIHLAPRDAEALDEWLPLLADIGIRLEPFGAHTFALRTLPAPALEARPALAQTEFARALLDELTAEAHTYNRLSPEALRERLAGKVACFTAIKGGDLLTPSQQQDLIEALWQTWSPATCPHGRPAFIALSLEELERRFQRR